MEYNSVVITTMQGKTDNDVKGGEGKRKRRGEEGDTKNGGCHKTATRQKRSHPKTMDDSFFITSYAFLYRKLPNCRYASLDLCLAALSEHVLTSCGSFVFTYSFTAPPITPATNCFWNAMKITRIGRVAMAVAKRITAKFLLVGLPSRTARATGKLYISSVSRTI